MCINRRHNDRHFGAHDDGEWQLAGSITRNNGDLICALRPSVCERKTDEMEPELHRHRAITLCAVPVTPVNRNHYRDQNTMGNGMGRICSM
jgi:hypothetical protein